MTNLPKFNFSDVGLTDETLNQKLEEDRKKEPRFFKPGRHQVRVIASKYEGQVESNPTWAKYMIEYEGTYNKTIREWIMVPTSTVSFTTKDGKETTFPLVRFKGFLEALGETFSLKTLAKTCQVYFGKDDALVGQEMTIEVGYQGRYVKYMGKDAAGNNRLAIVNREGEPLENLPEFASYDEANAYAKENNIALENFVNVLKHLSSGAKGSQGKASGDNW